MAVETATLTPIEMTGVQTRLNEAEEQALIRVLRESNALATGVEGEAFEKEFTDFFGSADSVCLSSCSSALELSAVLTDLKPGQEVILPAHTFCATGVPFARTGATLRWADIDPRHARRDGRDDRTPDLGRDARHRGGASLTVSSPTWTPFLPWPRNMTCRSWKTVRRRRARAIRGVAWAHWATSAVSVSTRKRISPRWGRVACLPCAMRRTAFRRGVYAGWATGRSKANATRTGNPL